LRIGNKIVCVNNHNADWLKIGKLYNIIKIDENPNIIWVENSPVMSYRFILLKEHRKIKLEKILIRKEK